MILTISFFHASLDYHERLLRQPILSPGGAFLVQSRRRTQVACVDLTCEKPRRALVSATSRRHSWIVLALGVCRSHAILLRPTIGRRLGRSRHENSPGRLTTSAARTNMVRLIRRPGRPQLFQRIRLRLFEPGLASAASPFPLNGLL